jgi:hypothetical protein
VWYEGENVVWGVEKIPVNVNKCVMKRIEKGRVRLLGRSTPLKVKPLKKKVETHREVHGGKH